MEIDGELAYGFLTKEFNFDEFRKQRTGLIQFDRKVAQAIAEPNKTIDKHFPFLNFGM
jgi:hypothetical protein